MKDLYVVNCCRTAIGSFGGSLKNTPAAEMGAVVVKEALKRANIAPENVDEVMFGCILTAAQGQNVARQVAIKAGIPYSVPAYTVGMVCGSGMKSVIEGARSILAGDSDVVVCGGTENMSAAPFASLDARWGARMGDKKLVDTMIKDGLWDAYNNYHMGTTAENINDGRVRRLLPAEDRGRPEGRPLRRRDRPRDGQGQEGNGPLRQGRVSQGRRHQGRNRQAARRVPRQPRVPQPPGGEHL